MTHICCIFNLNRVLIDVDVLRVGLRAGHADSPEELDKALSWRGGIFPNLRFLRWQGYTSNMKTPEQLIQTYFTTMAAQAWDELPKLYADDATVHHPFAKDDTALIKGREQLVHHFTGLRNMGLHLQVKDAVIQPMADPEWVTVRFVYNVRTKDGRQFELPGVFITHVRKGLIVESFDYLGL